jgi:cytochrome oxidase Cu insertion factor (SCO1/SenC/PrrC family)
VPAAPDQRQLLALAMRAGAYDGVRLGSDLQHVALTVTAGQVEPLLLGFDSGRLVTGAVYAGNDDVNLGLGELSGKFAALPAFNLLDQNAKSLNLDAIAGKDVIIAAFHTTCHETCPLYTALLLQLAKHLPATAMLMEVTTDPTVDTPLALAAYAKQVGAGWTFATGTPDEVANFWKPFAVGLAAGDSHISTLALVDRHGFVRLVYRGVPKIGGDILPSLVNSLSAQGLHELGSGGDGWGAPDVLQALTTIAGPERTQQSSGGQAGPFTLSATDGTKVGLADFSGKPVVINFWATYCPPCKAEMPLLAKLAGPQSGVRLVLIDEGDGRDATRAFLDGLGIHQPALLDSDLAVGHSYGVFVLPMTVFVRADGTIDRRQVGQVQEGVLASELSNLSSQ